VYQASSLKAAESAHLPLELLRLYRREREVATIIYSMGLASAKQVQAALSVPLTNAAVRSMLVRLVRKGILVQLKGNSNQPFLYGPALTEGAVSERTLLQFASDFHEGSLSGLAHSLAALVSISDH